MTPAEHARAALKQSGLSEPPIDEVALAASLGVKIRQLPTQRADPELAAALQANAVGALQEFRGELAVLVDPQISRERRRFVVFHELGHLVIPEHAEFRRPCTEQDMTATTKKQLEKEANRAAAEFLWPTDHFLADCRRRPIAVRTVSALAEKYVASFEATANRYATAHHGFCASMFIEEAATGSNRLVVRYFMRSRRLTSQLKKYVRPGQRILPSCPLYDLWVNEVAGRVQVPATDLGSSASWLTYEAECLPLRTGSKLMFVLLWVEDEESELGLFD